MSLSDREALTFEQDAERLSATNLKLLRQLEEAKNKKAELVQAAYQAAYDAASMRNYKPVKTPKKDLRRKRAPEVAISHLTDWQLAKVTPTYSSEVCANRIGAYGDKVIELTEIQRAHHPVRSLRVYLTGDLVEGELVFPGQPHLIDASLYSQVLVSGPQILGDFLRKMLANFDSVHVVGVIGNHGALGGRARKDYHPESNADAMMYEVVHRDLAAESRLTWAPNMTPGERHWYAIDRIGDGIGNLLFHGDQVKGGFAGFPWYGFGKKLSGWRMTLPAADGTKGQRAAFKYAFSGHYHTPVRFYQNGVTLWGGGSTESDNTYAAEMLAAAGEPSQWLLFSTLNGEMTNEYEVHLDDESVPSVSVLTA